jgi:CBS-domain-containing membrane protein
MKAPVLETRLELQADTAADLMTENPVSVSETATAREAMATLLDKGFSAAPVIDEAGRPVGVLSCSDLLVHDREKADHLREAPEYYSRRDLKAPGGESLGPGYQVENVDETLVRDLMTPTIFTVALGTPAAKVISELLNLHVHRLFVVDERGALVGVISTMDIIRHLRT